MGGQIKGKIYYALLGAAIAFAVNACWYATSTPSEQADIADEVKHAKQVNTAVESIKVYAGGEAIKKKLNLPSATIKNKSTHVIAATKVSESDYPRTVTTVIDVETGTPKTFIRQDKMPLFTLSDRATVGLFYGVKNGRSAFRLTASKEVARIKGIRIAAIGAVDFEARNGTDAFVGVGAVYQF